MSCNSSQQQYMEALGICSQYAKHNASEDLQPSAGGEDLFPLLLQLATRQPSLAYAALGYHLLLLVLLLWQQQNLRRCKQAKLLLGQGQNLCGRRDGAMQATAERAGLQPAGAHDPAATDCRHLANPRAQLLRERYGVKGDGFDDVDAGAPFAAYGGRSRGSGLRDAQPAHGGGAAVAAAGGSGSLVTRPAAALYAAAKAAAASGRRLTPGVGRGNTTAQGMGRNVWDDDIERDGSDQDKTGDGGQWTRDYAGRLIRAGMNAASGAAVRAGSGMGAAAGTAMKRAKGGAASAMAAAVASMTSGRAVATRQAEAKQEVVADPPRA
jgi:hypothetical protein